MYDRNDHASKQRSLWKIPETDCCNDTPDSSLIHVAEPGCAGGFLCYDGEPMQYIMCPMAGGQQMIYDERVGVCNWPNLVDCVSSCPRGGQPTQAPITIGASTPSPIAPTPATAPTSAPVSPISGLEVVKLAGPPGLCSEAGVGSLEGGLTPLAFY